jgi:hypothetical protein
MHYLLRLAKESLFELISTFIITFITIKITPDSIQKDLLLQSLNELKDFLLKENFGNIIEYTIILFIIYVKYNDINNEINNITLCFSLILIKLFFSLFTDNQM